MPLRILQVVASAERRGAETFAVTLEDELKRHGHDVQTVAVEPGLKPALDLVVMGERWSDPRSLRRLRRLMVDADVVVAHGSSALPAAAAAGIGCPTPVIYRQISDPEQWTTTRFRRWRVRLYLKRMRRVVALTNRTASLVSERFGIRPENITVIPNGADAGRFVPPSAEQRALARKRFGLAEDEFAVVWMGALSQEKRPAMAVEAMKRLGKGRLLIAGAGPLEEELARSTVSMNADMLGLVEEPLALYHAADVFLLTSRTESLPAVLIEAALCALPAVSTHVGDVAVILEHQLTGFLTPVDDVQAMVDALDQLCQNSVVRARLGAEARVRAASRFAISGIGDSWSDLVCAVADSPG